MPNKKQPFVTILLNSRFYVDPSTISHSLPQPSAAASAHDSAAATSKTKTVLIGSALNSRVNASAHAHSSTGQQSTVISRPGSTPQPTPQQQPVAAAENKCATGFTVWSLMRFTGSSFPGRAVRVFSPILACPWRKPRPHLRSRPRTAAATPSRSPTLTRPSSTRPSEAVRTTSKFSKTRCSL